MSGIVEYIIAIRGQVDANISKAMQGIGAAAQKMAADVNRAESSMQGALNKAQAATAAAQRHIEATQRQATVGAQALAGAVGNMERQMQVVQRNSQTMITGVQQQEAAIMNVRAKLAEYGAAGIEAAGKVRTLTEAQRELNRVMKEAQLANKWAPLSPPPIPGSPDRAAWEKAQHKTGAPVTAGGGGGTDGGPVTVSTGSGVMDKAWKAYGTYFLAKQAAHAAGALVHGPAELDTEQRKLALALSSYGHDEAKKLADQARDKAFDLSGRYKNTTVAENLRIANKLRSFLSDKFPEILNHDLEPFVKMHSMLKGYDGGKHGGSLDKTLTEIEAGIKSGELQGNLTGGQIAKHAQYLTMARILHGEDSKLTKYLQGNQQAIQPLAGADDNFKYIDFPIMMTRMNAGAGSALRNAFDRSSMGNRMMTQSAEYWRSLGLVDESKLKPWNYNKDGQIKGSTLIGTSWLKGSDEYARNLTDALMTRVLPAIAQHKGIKELEGVDRAWKAGDVDTLTKQMTALRANPAAFTEYQRALNTMFKFSKAIQGAEELTLGSPIIARRRKEGQAVLRELLGMDSFPSLGNSTQALSAQTERALIGATGKDFTGALMAATDKLSAAITALGTTLNAGIFSPFYKDYSADNRARLDGIKNRGEAWRHGREVYQSVHDRARRIREGAAVRSLRGDLEGDEMGYVGGGLSRGPGAAVAQAAAQRVQVQVGFGKVEFSPVTVTVNVPNAGSQTASSTASGGQAHSRGEAMAPSAPAAP